MGLLIVLALLFLRGVDVNADVAFKQLGTKLTTDDPTQSLGSATAISADGKVLCVGARFDTDYMGAAYIYEQDSEGNYPTTPIKKVGTGGVGYYVWQGYSITVSGDGLTFSMGGREDNNGIGAVWIFYRSVQDGWIQQHQDKIIGIGRSGPNGIPVNMGESVSLSYNGNVLAFGAQGDGYDRGSVYIWIRDGSLTWSQEALLYPNDEAANGYFGCSVSLSSDGNIFAAGGYYDNAARGATWIFQKVNGVWSQQGSKIVAPGSSAGGGNGGGQSQGKSVSLSGDGKVLAIGSPDLQVAWVYERDSITNPNWNETGHLISGTGGQDYPQQGNPVLLSKDGTILIISGPNDHYFPGDPNDWMDFGSALGAVWIFVKNQQNGQWEQQGSKLFPNDNLSGSGFGSSISLSDDNKLLLIGGPTDNTPTLKKHGAVWLFRNGAPCTGSTPPTIGTTPDCGTTPDTQTCSAPCDQGYTGGPVTFLCNDGIWDSAVGSCSGLNCPQPTIASPALAGTCSRPRSSGSTCQRSCPDGYTMVGDPTMTCSDGAWISDPSFSCNGGSSCTNTYCATLNRENCNLNHQCGVCHSGYTSSTPDDPTVTCSFIPVKPIITLKSSLNPAEVTEVVTFTITLYNPQYPSFKPTGHINFFDGSSLLAGSIPLNNGVGTFTTTTLSSGIHEIVASYAGDENYLPVDSTTFPQTILAVPPTFEIITSTTSGILSLKPGPSSITHKYGTAIPTISYGLFSGPSYIFSSTQYALTRVVTTNKKITIIINPVRNTIAYLYTLSWPVGNYTFTPTGFTIVSKNIEVNSIFSGTILNVPENQFSGIIAIPPNLESFTITPQTSSKLIYALALVPTKGGSATV